MDAKEKKEHLLRVLQTEDIQLLKQLIAKGVNPDMKLNGAKQTLLCLAVSENKRNLIEFLLTQQIDINSRTHSGATPLAHAKEVDIAKMLVENGADIHARDKKGNSILHFPIVFGYQQLTQYFNTLLGFHSSQDELRNSPPLSEDIFWSLIEHTARKTKGDPAWQARELVMILREKDPGYILGFEKTVWAMTNKCATSDLWAAVYLIQGGCSDECFVKFRSWLVGLGKSKMEKAILKPDVLLKYFDDRTSYANYTNIETRYLIDVALFAYKARTGKDDFFDVISYANVKTDNEGTKMLHLDWDEKNMEHLRPKMPAIFQKYYTKK